MTDRATAYARAVVAGSVVANKLVTQACARHLRDLDDGPARGLVWDVDESESVIDFFSAVLCLPEQVDANDDADDADDGDPLDGTPFMLQPWQQFICGSLMGWYRVTGGKRRRRYTTGYIETAKGTGKALALATPIPTVQGWTTMGAIRAGDEVFDERGRPCRVRGVFDVMTGRPCAAVVFDDGSEIIADDEHLWWTEMRQAAPRADGKIATAGVRRAQHGLWRRGIRTTAEIARTLRYSNGRYQSANHSVPLAGAIDTPETDLPIEPYALGVWLGDGDSDCARITAADSDAEVLAHVAAAGVAVGPRAPQGRSTVGRYRIGGAARKCDTINARLRALGLLGRKRIPAMYLRASISQRLSLLQGLMDTDGYIDPLRSGCEFCSTDRDLANDVAELIVSLGIKVRIRESAARLYGREVSRRWRLVFFPPPDLPVFLLQRKLVHQRARHSRRRLSADRRIVDVRPVPSVPVRCIAVDSPSSLYLAGTAMIPTHNTPLCAGLILYRCVADGVTGGQFYAAATAKDQAKIAFADIEKMVEASPHLRSLFLPTVNNLAMPSTGSFIRAISSERRGLDGKRVTAAVLDEVHEQRDATVVNKMRKGTKGQPNALILEPTNSGYDRTSVCWAHHEYSRRVLDGTVDADDWFAFVCGLDPCRACADAGKWFPDTSCAECDRWDVEGPHWLKAHPNLGVSVHWDYMRKLVNQARGMPSAVSDLLRFAFCVWTAAQERAIDMGRWAACQPMPSDDELVGLPCYGGLDLGSVDDLSAWARGWELPDGTLAVRLRFFAPSDAVHRFPHRPYQEWQRAGLLELTEGEVTDFELVRERIIEDCARDGITTIAYDPYSAKETAQVLLGQGLDMVPVRQGFALHEAILRVLGMIKSGELRHGNHRILTWMASNAVALTGAKGEKRWAKEKSPEKIDGIVAVTNLVHYALVAREREPVVEVAAWMI